MKEFFVAVFIIIKKIIIVIYNKIVG